MDSLGARSLAQLLCPVSFSYAPYRAVEKVLRRRIFLSGLRLLKWRRDEYSEEGLNEIAFHLRQLLENAATRLLLGVDPVRVLMVAEAQKESSYALEKRNPIAIQWTGDIFPRDKNKLKKLEGSVESNSAERALFSTLNEIMIWKPAVIALNDMWGQLAVQNVWQIEFAQIPIESFISRVSKPIGESFSYTSKKIHAEYLIDEDPIKAEDFRQIVAATIKWLALCGAVLYKNPIKRNLHESVAFNKLFNIVENKWGNF